MALDGLVVIVTGASRGLGERMARAVSDEGASVVCAARSEKPLANLVEDLNEHGSAIGIPTDVRSRDDVRCMVEETLDAFGRIDALVNNAGVAEKVLLQGEEPPVVDLPVHVWQTIIDTNLTGVFRCTKAVLPTMLEGDEGRLIHVSSGMGRLAQPNRAAYVASKFGLEAFHRSLAQELQDTAVDSLVLDPGGPINTDGFTRYKSEAERAHREDPSVIAEPAVRLIAGEGTNGGRYDAIEDF